MDTIFDRFVPRRRFLVCVDSDGCAMDTMDIKHFRCFGPCMVREWELDQWAGPILSLWNDLNLYTLTRGINRFKGLALALGEVHKRYSAIDGVEELNAWVKQASELSNRAVEAMYEKTRLLIFAKALNWSRAVNEAVNTLSEDEKKPFPGVAEGLRAAHEFADIAVVSSANREAVEEEWKRCGLLDFVDILLCQDAGSKSRCISRLMKKGYGADHILMVGDAPGDLDSARENGVFFYPILVRHEAESWEELKKTGLEAFRGGRYASYGQEKMRQFMENLGGAMNDFE